MLASKRTAWTSYDLPFLLERMKTGKVENLVANLYDNRKRKYVLLIGNLKQALNNGLVLKRVNRVIKFDQEALLKSYIMKKKGKKKTKVDFEKDSKLMNSENNLIFCCTVPADPNFWQIKLIIILISHTDIFLFTTYFSSHFY